MRIKTRIVRSVPMLLLLGAMPLHAQVLVSQVYGGGGNAGAQYKNDFIELFNAGTSTVDLGGWSVQYASATGTSWQVTQLSGSLQPGQYLLVQEAVGANTAAAALPTPDATGTIAMSGTAGKVALSNGIVALAGACPAAQSLVAFGSTANCPNPTATLSNTTAALRNDGGCANTGNNTADFSALAPAPRNRASAPHSCGGVAVPTDPSATATISPASAKAGEDVLLRVTVVPGANPASTGLAVIANLAPIGGATDQPLYDDGTHGDAVAGDKVYSLSTTVAPGTAAGGKVIGIGVADEQARTASLTVSLSVIQLLAIHDVQGAGLASPYAGQNVSVEGIVTARKSNGFFVQAADDDADANAATSEGVFVFTSSAPPAAAAVGARVRVQGGVTEFTPSSNPHQLSLTEISSNVVVSQLSTGNPLPAPVEITEALANAASETGTLERLEGMRVTVPQLRVVAPVGGFIDEANASSVSDGVFYGVVPTVARPFREPGIGALDTTPIPVGVSPPRFDTNPERIRVQSTGQAGALAMSADVNDVVNGLVGVLDYGFGAYSLLPDPNAAVNTVPGANPTPVSVAKSNEITIGGFNLLRFFDDVNDPAIGEPVLTSAALANRLHKTANAICGYVRTPDILGVVEVENLPVLQRLADTINNGDTLFPGSCAKNPHYVARLMEGNDIGGIDAGFLISTEEVAPGVPRVEVQDIYQIGAQSVLNNPDGSTSLLNDRPSLVLMARIHNANGAHYDVTVIANHLRSLSDVNSMAAGSNGWATAGERVRAKRAAQAKELADHIQFLQTTHPGDRIVLLGDFNAFEFNDGYVDSMGVITGHAAGPNEVLDYVASPVTKPLTNMASLSPEGDRYSFSFDGSAQSLDHMVVNQVLLDTTAGVRAEHARINADFGEDNFGDYGVPVRVSDHDPVVLFLSENSFANADLATSVQASAGSAVVGSTVGFGVGASNGGPDAARAVKLRLVLNRLVANVSVQAPAGWECAAPMASGGTTVADCSAENFAANANAAFSVTVPTDRELAGTLTLSAHVSSPMTDPERANNDAAASTELTASADLAAAVLAPKGPLNSKKPAAFAIGISNAGPQDARGAVLVISVNGPKELVTGITAPGLSCSNLDDRPNASNFACTTGDWYNAGRTNGIVVNVDPALTDGSVLTVGAGFSAYTPDPNLANNQSGAAVKVVGSR